jgi:hypothetical protein
MCLDYSSTFNWQKWFSSMNKLSVINLVIGNEKMVGYSDGFFSTFAHKTFGSDFGNKTVAIRVICDGNLDLNRWVSAGKLQRPLVFPVNAYRSTIMDMQEERFRETLGPQVWMKPNISAFRRLGMEFSMPFLKYGKNYLELTNKYIKDVRWVSEKHYRKGHLFHTIKN